MAAKKKKKAVVRKRGAAKKKAAGRKRGAAKKKAVGRKRGAAKKKAVVRKRGAAKKKAVGRKPTRNATAKAKAGQKEEHYSDLRRVALAKALKRVR